jgi:hypothetical protein
MGHQAHQMALSQVERLAGQHLYRHTAAGYQIQDKG